MWKTKSKRQNPNLSLKIEWWNAARMEGVRDRHGEFERVSGKEEDEQSEMFEEKLKRFKKLTKFAQNTRFSRLRQVTCKSLGPATRTLRRKLWKKFLSFFATESSRVQVARTSRQNTWKRNLKKFLSVFRDWKFHSRESRELSCENLCVPLAIGPSTREQVANLSREKHEILNFWKIF